MKVAESWPPPDYCELARAVASIFTVKVDTYLDLDMELRTNINVPANAIP
jgi:hypothetical protein